MNEEQAAKIVKEEINKSNSPLLSSEVSVPLSNTDGSQASGVSTSGLIEQAEKATRELKDQLDRRERLLLQEKELLARRMLSGRAEAGIVEKPKTQDELNKEAARKLLEGTGLKIY